MTSRSIHVANSIAVRAVLLMALIALALALLPADRAAAQGTTFKPDKIVILPIDKARFVTGQAFDLRIEVGDNVPATGFDAAKEVQITIDGKSLKDSFNKDFIRSSAKAGSVEFSVRKLAWSTPGQHTVSVKVGETTKTATYNVETPKPVDGKQAKNVILFIGDGMGLPALTMARIVSRGLTQGKFNKPLEIDQMEEMGLVSTSGYDSLVTDSANSASAYGTGHKSVVNAMGVYEDNTADPFDDPQVENIVELAKRSRDMAVGLVTTSEIEDATPAAMIAHTRRRAEKQAIANQFIDGDYHRPEVIMGGGSAYFIPKSTAGSKRTNERNLIDEFKQLGYTVVSNRAEMKAAPNTAPLLGLYHPADMNAWIDREALKDASVLGPYTDQPTLYEMTEKALSILSSLPNGKQNGFFLLVEGASIDKQLHPMDWERATGETIELDKAVGVAKQFAKNNPDTLIVVTADHSHSVSVYGTYDTTKGPANRDAVGTYDKALFPTFEDRGDGFPKNWSPSRTLAVGFANFPDHKEDYLFNPKPLSPTIQDPSVKDKAVYIPNPERDPQGIERKGNLPPTDSTEVHSADDVLVFASGPGARYFKGFQDNTNLFFGLMNALSLDATKTMASTGSITAANVVSTSSPGGAASGASGSTVASGTTATSATGGTAASSTTAGGTSGQMGTVPTLLGNTGGMPMLVVALLSGLGGLVAGVGLMLRRKS